MIAEIPDPPLHDKKPEINQSQARPNSKFPVGLILIIILTGLGTIGSLSTIINPTIIIGTYVVTGFPALLYGIVHMGVYIVLFMWLIQRKEWGRKLGIIVSIFNILLATFTFFTMVYSRDKFMAAYDVAMPGYSDIVSVNFLFLIFGVMAILNWLVGIAIILYLHFKKRYFKA
jgi:hypothetical protein